MKTLSLLFTQVVREMFGLNTVAEINPSYCNGILTAVSIEVYGYKGPKLKMTVKPSQWSQPEFTHGEEIVCGKILAAAKLAAGIGEEVNYRTWIFGQDHPFNENYPFQNHTK